MQRFFSVFKMDLTNLFKNPVLVGYNTVFAALITAIMGFLMSGSYANAADSYQYYTVTMMLYGVLNGAMTASNCFMERDIKRPNLRIIFSPAGSFPIYFSKILASFVFDYSLHLALLALWCPALHISLGSRPVFFLLLLAPIEFASAALGTFFCCVFHSEETTSTLLSLVISVLCILGGSFFSLDGMGKGLALLSRLSPVKWLNDAFFALCCDDNLHLFMPVFLGATAISALLVLGCRVFFSTEDYL